LLQFQRYRIFPIGYFLARRVLLNDKVIFRSHSQRSRSLGTKMKKKSFLAHIFMKSASIYIKPTPK